MPDIRLKVLALSRDNPNFDVGRLGEPASASLGAELDALDGAGIISRSQGTWTMNGVQRVRLAEQLVHSGKDPRKVSRLLGWQEFEDFAKTTFTENGFQAEKHLVFRTPVGRREIDILAWNNNFALAVDCKHWRRGLSPSSVKVAVTAQVERVRYLARRIDLLHRLKMPQPESRNIIPVILTLSETRDWLVDGVPVVPVSKLVNFIYGLSPIDRSIRRVPVAGHGTQVRLK